MDLILVELDGAEWNYMWEWLHSHPINEGIEQPSLALNEGEAWQYMGTFKQNERAIHEFRHRKHPKTNMVQSLKLEASKGFDSTQIMKKYRL